ncbi:hypothetical protein KAU33_07780, partial [Candidatus Dependentiae bacterium]|nr:hypothetical protein [Candidatus Dependentiae bacterium]
ILAHIFNIETSGTQPSWTVGLYSDSSCTIPLTDSNSDLIPDTGNLLSGVSFTFYLKLEVPGTETLGTIDTTQIDVEAADDNKITADNFAYTEVKKGIIITPDKTTESGTNSYVFIEHYIQNNFSYSNTVNFTMTGIPPGWAVKLFESDGVTELVDNDGDSNVDITDVSPYGEPYYIKSRIYIPAGVPEGIVGEITITADSNSVSDTVLETITVRTLISYASSAYTNIKKIFTIGETIYVKASGITSGKVVILWFDNTPTLVYTSPEIQVNASGIAKNEYVPIPGNQIGDWSIIIYESKNGNPTGSPLGTAYVNVGEIVSSGDTLKLFPSWSPEDNRVSYISETAAFNDNWHIYYLDLTTLTETKLTDVSDVASLIGINTAPECVHYSKISWDPDSSPTEGRIIFAAVDKDDSFDNSELYTVNLTQDATGRYPIKKVSPVGMYGNPLEGYGGWVDPNWDSTGFYVPEADGNWVAAAVRGNIFVFKPDSITDGPPSAGGNYKKIIRITNLALSSSVDGLFEPIWFTEGSDLKLAVVYKGISAKSDVYIISNVDDIISETMASPNFGSHLFDYSTEVSAQYRVNDVTDMIKVTETINPIWGITTSPDGLKISFSEDTANIFNNSNFYTSPYAALVNTDFDVYKIDASTTPVPVELFSHPYDEGFGEWSNNGQYLIYIDQPTDDDPSPGNQHTLFLKKFYIVNSIIFGTSGGGFRKN